MHADKYSVQGIVFFEKTLVQTTDRSDLGYPDEWEFRVRWTDLRDGIEKEKVLLYCASGGRDNQWNRYQSERDRFLHAYPWIPVRKEGVHHSIGIVAHPLRRTGEYYHDMEGEFSDLPFLIPSAQTPLIILPPPEDWLMHSQALSEAIIERVKKDPSSLHLIKPHVFEQLFLELLASRGFTVEWTGRIKNVPGDGIAYFVLPNDKRLPFLVECKRWAPHRPVGIEVADRLYGAMTRENMLGFLVTTSSFTRGVWEKYGGIWQLDLTDLKMLRNLLDKYVIKNGLHLRFDKR